MANSGSHFELPGKVEHYLGILSKVYKREGHFTTIGMVESTVIQSYLRFHKTCS
jgi:hypothetical protein